MKDTRPPAVAIVGPTASGKTSLSITLAKDFSGEVISADSRQVYKGMDIGTAKVTPEEMGDVPHHLLDVCDPKTVYTAMDFVRDAENSLKAITTKGNLPIVAGGTFFYLDLLRGNISAPKVPPNHALRAELEQLPNHTLLQKLEALDSNRAKNIDSNNPRRLVRAIEIASALGHVPDNTKNQSPYRWLIIGIDIPLELLEKRIQQRVLERLDEGMIEEVERLHQEGVSYERLDSLGLEYRYISQYLQGTITKEKMIEEIVTKSRQFAKRQKTWLKRDKDINWLEFPVDVTKATKLVKDFI